MSASDPRPLTVAELERWTSFGAHWRLQRIEEERVIVELCQCTGELVERRAATDPDVIAYLREHAGETD